MRETLLETGPIFRVKVKDAFRTLDEYLITMATAVQREWDARREIAVQMKKQQCTIVLVADQKTRKREDGLLRRYFAFVKLDSAEDLVRHLLGSGDRVNLADEIQDFEFDEDPETAGINEELAQVKISKKFTGKGKSKGKGKIQGVVLGLPYFARFFDLCLAINLDKRTHVPNFFKPAISDPRNLEESSGSTCFLDPIDSDRPSRKLFKALARFQKLQEKFTDITKVLLGNDMSTSRETNPYQDLPQKAIGAIGSLCPDQRLVFEDASKVNNRLQVLIGPPGTGKTHTLAHMALANAFAGKVTVVATVTNHACNVATNLIKRVFYEHHADFLFCRYEALSLALKVRANQDIHLH
jgi:flagellar biosynthesis GTPase FlhF